VTVTGPGAGALPAGIALPAEKLGDLGLQHGLQQQPRTQPGDLLEDLTEVTVGGEQLVDLGSDAVSG
jgi:hypothetical protein